MEGLPPQLILTTFSGAALIRPKSPLSDRGGGWRNNLSTEDRQLGREDYSILKLARGSYLHCPTLVVSFPTLMDLISPTIEGIPQGDGWGRKNQSIGRVEREVGVICFK